MFAGLERAEELSLELFWITARTGSGSGRDALSILASAAAAAHTRTLTIVAGPVRLPLHQPLRVAEDAATLDGLAGGRLEISLAPSVEPSLVPDCDGSLGDLDGLAEEVALLRQAWATRPIDLPGRFQRYSGVDVHPKPARTGGPPLWVEAPDRLDPAAPVTDWIDRLVRLDLGIVLESVDAAMSLLDQASKLDRASKLAPASMEGASHRGLRLALRLPWLLLGDSSPAPTLPAPLRAVSASAACEELDRLMQRHRSLAEIDLLMPSGVPGLSPEQCEISASLLASRLRTAVAS
jgi:hypothetical protein